MIQISRMMGHDLWRLGTQRHGQRHTEGEGDKGHHQCHHIGHGEAGQIGHKEDTGRHGVAYGQKHHDQAHKHSHHKGDGGHPQNMEQQPVFIFDPAQAGKAVSHGLQVNKSADHKGYGKSRNKVFGKLLEQRAPENHAGLPKHMLTVQKKSRSEAEEIALKLLDKVGMLDRKDFYPSKMSGGQQQRVGIARAMAVNSDVLLFDEPTSALDPELVGEVLNTIKALAEENTTMILVTHEVRFARNVASRIIFMEDGQIAADGTPEEIIDQPENPRLQKFLNFITN